MSVPLVSLNDFCKNYCRDSEKRKAIFYYGDLYKRSLGSNHIHLPMSVWRGIEDTLFKCDELADLTLDQLKGMIKRYISKEHTREIEYYISSFNLPEVKIELFYEVCY